MKWYEIILGLVVWIFALWFYGYLREQSYGYYPKFKKQKPFRESILVKIKQFYKLKLYRKYFWFYRKK